MAQKPLIDPTFSYATVTDKISSIVLTRKTSIYWLMGLALAFGLLMVMMLSLGMLLAKGVGVWGLNNPVGWGFRYYEFRLVDRHWPCGHADLCHSAAFASEVADLY